MHNGKAAVRQVLHQSETITQTVKRFPPCDLSRFRSIVNDILRFLKIWVTASWRERIIVHSKDQVDIVGHYRSEVSGHGIAALYPVFVELDRLEFDIFELKIRVLEINDRR